MAASRRRGVCVSIGRCGGVFDHEPLHGRVRRRVEPGRRRRVTQSRLAFRRLIVAMGGGMIEFLIKPFHRSVFTHFHPEPAGSNAGLQAR